MAGKSKIEWTDQTWNPIVGCSIVSPGCTHCYAMAMASRIEAMGNQPRYAGTTRKVNGNAVWTGKLAQAPEATLLAPLRRKKPTTYFVNSMGDLFHEDCPDEWIDRVFAVMALCPQHTFQVLTKRAARMREYFSKPHSAPNVDAWHARVCGTIDRIVPERRARSVAAKRNLIATKGAPLPNVWLGISAERQQEWDDRKEHLRATPAAVRFASFEPLLGSIVEPRPMSDFIQWAIPGGESGPNARPMHPDWARSLRDQCAEAGVAYFFKQWGNWKPLDQFTEKVIKSAGVHAVVGNDGRFIIDTDIADPPRAVFTFKMGKHDAGRLLDGIEHNAMPERQG